MYAIADIVQCQKVDSGTELLVHIPEENIEKKIHQKRMCKVEMRFDDGRTISMQQRKKAYATIKDISDYTGYLPEEQKQWLKFLYVARTGKEYFSFSDCSMDTAREFINIILEYAIQEGIPLTESGIDRTDDINKYLYFCLIHKKCAVCGRPGEIHHEDTIGMGNDRRKVNDSNHKKICLCRTHHSIAHSKGILDFTRDYKVYGIVLQ